MQFNRHPNLEGRHALLSPSQHSWVNYTEDKMDARFLAATAAVRGTELHKFAADAIRLGINLPKTKKTINLYVNDCIGYKMRPEVALFYSQNCFGTADAIGFRKNKLRIFDLKNGIHQASVRQLLVYAAIFCLEYHFKPFDIDYDLRIYQRNEVAMFDTDKGEVAHIVDRIQTWDQRINDLKAEME